MSIFLGPFATRASVIVVAKPCCRSISFSLLTLNFLVGEVAGLFLLGNTSVSLTCERTVQWSVAHSGPLITKNLAYRTVAGQNVIQQVEVVKSWASM